MTEEKKEDFIPDPENSGLECQLTPECVDNLNKVIEEMRKAEEAEDQKTEPVKLKYPDNIICRCRMQFFLTNDTCYEEEMTVPMCNIEQIQKNMASSLEAKDASGVIYLEGSKINPADFCVLPIKNILYTKFTVIDSQRIPEPPKPTSKSVKNEEK